MTKMIRMQTHRLRISSAGWKEILPGNPGRKYFRIAIGAGSVVPTNPGVVQVAFDSPGEEYLLVWVMRPFEPQYAPGNKVLLRAQKPSPSLADPNPADVEVVVEVTEGVEVEV